MTFRQRLINDHYSRPLRFLLSGGLATSSHWILMWVLMESGWAARSATAAGAVLGALVNYALQYWLTFTSQRPHQHAVPAYVAICVVLWLGNLTVFDALSTVVGVATAPAQLITTCVMTCASFLLYREVVFSEATDV